MGRPTAAAACLSLARFTRHAPQLAGAELESDWETSDPNSPLTHMQSTSRKLCSRLSVVVVCRLAEGVVAHYGATYSIADHISEAVPRLREHYDKYANDSQ